MAAPQVPLRVLLVDDETEFLTATAKALRRRGFDPSTADNGLSALDLIEKEGFDAVVLDVKMPGIDGEQVFYEVRRRWPAMPVVILTGHGTVQQAFKTSRDGLYEYLPKPCDVEELAEVLRKAAAAPKTQRSGRPDVLPIRLIHLHGSSLASNGLSDGLKKRGMHLFSASDAGGAMSVIRNQSIDVLLVDLTSVTLRGGDLVRLVRDRQQFLEVVLLVDRRSLRQGIEAMKAGAYDVLMTPVDLFDIEECIRQAREHRAKRTAEEIDRRVQEVLERYPD